MLYSSAILALAAGAAAQSRGFNYGANGLDGSPRTLQDYTDQFKAAKALPGTNGQFTSARLFTMLQPGADNTVISAIQAAIDTDTSLLLGLWGSGGQDGFNAELGALRSAIEQHGDAFASRVVGISVGSEDLYRESPTGILNKSGVGASPDTIVSYIRQLRELVADGPLSKAPIGHVDTWTAWVNGSNSAVIDAVDWLGTDAYPYFQSTEANGIDRGESLFFAAYDATVGAAGGKPVWITETGWPVEGPASNEAQASTQNAEKYWQDVACRVLGTDTNLWWFTLDDDQATSDDVSFSLVNPSDLFGQPLYDLSCFAQTSSSSSSSSSSSAVPTSTEQPTTVIVVPTSTVNPTTESSSVPTETLSVDPIPGTVSSTLTIAVPPPAQTSDAAPQDPVVVTSAVVVPAPTSDDTSAAASPTAQSTEALPFDGGAARVAGGAAAGLAAVFAFFL